MSIKQGDYLKKLRTENKMSQEALAEKLGVSRQSISKWEQGYAVPDTDNMLKLSKIYGLSVDYILNCGEETTSDSTDKNIVAKQEKTVSSDVSVEDKNADNIDNGNKEVKKKRGMLFAVYPFVAVLVTVALGVASPSLWKSSWIFILTIPVFYSFIIAKEKKNPLWFLFPFVPLILFLVCGFCFDLWHPMWILFLTIPIYYLGAIHSYRNSKK